MAKPRTIPELLKTLQTYTSDRARDSGQAFVPGTDDCFICTYPKSGTNWLMQIAHQIRTRGSMAFDHIYSVVPLLEGAADLGVDLNHRQVARPRLFKTHYPQREIPQGGRYIYCQRHPYDVAVSFYHYMSGWFFEAGSISLDDYVEGYLLARAGRLGGYWDHVSGWWPRRQDPDVLYLFYEDLQRDLSGSVRRVADFLGFDGRDRALINRVVRHAGFDFMKAHAHKFDESPLQRVCDARAGIEAEANQTIASGVSGRGRSLLSARSTAALDRRWAETIGARYGYADYESMRLAQSLN